jgi:hypothetical protein
MRKIYFVFFLLLILIISLFVRVEYVDLKERNLNSKNLIGTYIIDLKKTNLREYFKDSLVYKKMTLTFYKDHTFRFNMDVPFIYFSKGTWKAAGSDLDEWNQLLNNGYDFAQVGRCCSLDSTIMLNSTTPKNGEYPIQSIFFKKIP